MPHPGEYTVGWICAISTEYVAAQVFLDEKHEGIKHRSLNDNNDYTLGKVGEHNVVIAVLPQGEYGTSAATGVAKDMLYSFPNVRIGLMVGIGGGAPSLKHDIRLGDIVVSASGNGKSGVLQYDFGKTIQGHHFQRTGFLNQPPTILRTAVNGLRAEYEIEGHRLERTISRILEKKPRLQKKYKRPDPSSDRLYKTEVTHRDSEASCTVSCSNNPSKLIFRPERKEDEDNPTIHYGLIASANQVMKDALERDKLIADEDVLCFEMEAGGLMNHFPCLVIRGICDYSDSHKNKEWQGYAAMAAAAYAKDLLCRIRSQNVKSMRRIIDILSNQTFIALASNLEASLTQEQDLRMEYQDGLQEIEVRIRVLEAQLNDARTRLRTALDGKHDGGGKEAMRQRQVERNLEAKLGEGKARRDRLREQFMEIESRIWELECENQRILQYAEGFSDQREAAPSRYNGNLSPTSHTRVIRTSRTKSLMLGRRRSRFWPYIFT